jgi:predicted alpha/beta superfamily hydrolase
MIGKKEDDMFSCIALGAPGNWWIDAASAKAVKPQRA